MLSRRAVRSESCCTKVRSAVVGPHVEAGAGAGDRKGLWLLVEMRAGGSRETARRLEEGPPSTLWEIGWGA